MNLSNRHVSNNEHDSTCQHRYISIDASTFLSIRLEISFEMLWNSTMIKFIRQLWLNFTGFRASIENESDDMINYINIENLYATRTLTSVHSSSCTVDRSSTNKMLIQSWHNISIIHWSSNIFLCFILCVWGCFPCFY
jgi:hypothetical protein